VIETLELEIGAIEVQLVKLRQEQQELQQSLPVPVGGPEQIAIAAKAAAVAFAERKPQLDGVADAITLLESQIPPKRAELAALQKQQDKNVLTAKIDELEPELLEVSHRINHLSNQMDAACEEFRGLALQYNRVASELGNEQVFPIAMNISGLPWAVSQVGRRFSLRLGMRKLGQAIAFEQQPHTYTPPSSSPMTSVETRIALLKSSLSGLKNHRETIADLDADRIVMVEQQIAETQRQIKILEVQEATV
jgi:hypothetical protein